MGAERKEGNVRRNSFLVVVETLSKVCWAVERVLKRLPTLFRLWGVQTSTTATSLVGGAKKVLSIKFASTNRNQFHFGINFPILRTMMKIQRRQITGYAYKVAKSMMPKISG